MKKLMVPLLMAGAGALIYSKTMKNKNTRKLEEIIRDYE